MIETIQFSGKDYPKLQSEGEGMQYAIPFIKKICSSGIGIDIGYSKPEWKIPGALGVDLDRVCDEHGTEINIPGHNATNFDTNEQVDWIGSSHCLEHLPDYVKALDYWSTKIVSGGVLFLYLPNMDYQEYWNPANNRKHLCYISPKVMQSYFDNRKYMWTNVFVTQGYDLNGSFYAIAEKI